MCGELCCAGQAQGPLLVPGQRSGPAEGSARPTAPQAPEDSAVHTSGCEYAALEYI